jgi:hypothetical protein
MRSVSTAVLAVLLVSCLASGAPAGQFTLAITQVWQHKDTNMLCIPGADPTIHAWNHATVCMHCGTYCAPAACSMYALYFGAVPPRTDQDHIYDNAKLSGGEILGNGMLETHALGMYAGTAMKPPEIQTAFQYAVGMWPTQWGPTGSPFTLLTPGMVIILIHGNNPILWIDMGSWPADQETIPEELYYDSGHCKIIAGYDDMGTADYVDDQYLIYDPWPNSSSPYWLPQAQVIDVVDIYLSIWDGISTEDSSWGAVKRLMGL